MQKVGIMEERVKTEPYVSLSWTEKCVNDSFSPELCELKAKYDTNVSETFLEGNDYCGDNNQINNEWFVKSDSVHSFKSEVKTERVEDERGSHFDGNHFCDSNDHSEGAIEDSNNALINDKNQLWTGDNFLNECVSKSRVKQEQYDHADNHMHRTLYHCELCTHGETEGQHCKEHIDSIHNGIENLDSDLSKLKKFKCTQCDYSTARNASLKLHVNAIHSKLVKFKCSQCDYSTTRKSSLRIHVNAIHLKERNHECPQCDYSTAHRSHLKDHIDAVHLNVKKHKCLQCDYSATLKSNLKSHVDSVHLKAKKHKCTQCDYSTTQRYILKYHIDGIHLKVKNHKCSQCDYSTIRKSDLKTHMDGIHLKVKKNRCSQCAYSTNRENDLKKHMDAIHLNAKNHKCSICNYAATQKTNLKRHMDHYHSKMKDEKC